MTVRPIKLELVRFPDRAMTLDLRENAAVPSFGRNLAKGQTCDISQIDQAAKSDQRESWYVVAKIAQTTCFDDIRKINDTCRRFVTSDLTVSQVYTHAEYLCMDGKLRTSVYGLNVDGFGCGFKQSSQGESLLYYEPLW